MTQSSTAVLPASLGSLLSQFVQGVTNPSVVRNTVSTTESVIPSKTLKRARICVCELVNVFSVCMRVRVCVCVCVCVCVYVCVPAVSCKERSIEFFLIEFYKIYRIYRICRRLVLVIFIFKTTKNVFCKFYLYCVFLGIDQRKCMKYRPYKVYSPQKSLLQERLLVNCEDAIDRNSWLCI